MCAVMVMVAMVPLASGGEYQIVKGLKGPRNSAVTWDYEPPGAGVWTLSIDNDGLRWMVVDVYDNTTSTVVRVMHERIRFAAFDAFPTGLVYSEPVNMERGQKFIVTVTPNGPRFSKALVADVFTPNQPPIAYFVPTMDNMTATVNAAGSSDPDGHIVDYMWDWGDLTTGNGIIAVHTYEVAGDYTITLVVTDNQGATGDTTRLVTAVEPSNQKPVAAFTYLTNGLEVSVNAADSKDPDGTIESYDWDFGDGATATGVTATHTYSAEGTYTITLVVTDDDGATGTTSKDVYVKPVVDEFPVARFTWTASNLVVDFDASTSSDDHGIVSWDWDFGDGSTGSGEKVSHTFAAPNTYPVTLTVTDTIDQTNSVTHDVVVTIKQAPVAAFTPTMTWMTVSVDAQASSDEDGYIVTYAWLWGDGATGDGVKATHVYALKGFYDITLTVTDNDGLKGTLTKQVEAIPEPIPPTASFTWTAVDRLVSFDASTSTDPDSTIVSYAWDFGDSTTGTGMKPTHEYSADGTYSVKLTVTDSQTLTGTQTKSVTVHFNQPPVASFTIQKTYLDVLVNAAASTDPDGTIASYVWDFGDSSGTATGVTKTHTYASAGTYTIKLTVTDNGGKTGTLSQPVTVVANPPPTAVITVVSQADLRVVLSGASSTDDSAVVSYAWNFGDTQTATGKDVTHDYAAAGTYIVTLTVTDDFGLTGSTTKSLTVTLPVPVEERLYKVYDMFEQPWGQWWTDPTWGRWVSYGTDIMLSFEPHMRTMLYMPGVDLAHAYQGVIYAPYRYQVDARNVTNLNIGKPEFMPVQNPSASSAGALAKIDMYWEYLDQTWWDNYWWPVWGSNPDFQKYSFFPGADDGYYIGTIYNINMNRQAALKWLNMPTTVNPVTWWGDPTSPTSNAALYNKAWIAWLLNEANKRLDIYNGYASLYYQYGAYMKLAVAGNGDIQLQIGHISFGFEILQVKWMKDAGLSPHECYMEDYTLNATYTADKAWVKADGVCEYSLKAQKANQTTSTPAWVFEADRVDYVGSSTKHPYSEYDPYVGLTYKSWNAGDTFYGQYVPYDATPGWLNLSDHDKLTVQLPTGTAPGYKPVALTPADYDKAIAGDLSGFTKTRQDGVLSLGYSVTNPANPLNLVPLYNTATKTLVIKGPYNFDNVLNPAATSPSGARYHGAPWIEFNVGPAAAAMSVDTSSSGASVVGGSASSETSIVAALVSVAMLGGLMGAVVIGLGRKEPEPEAT